MGRGAVLRVVVGMLALVAISPASASANCGIQPTMDFYSTTHPRYGGPERIDTAFFGTVVSATGPRWGQQYVVTVEDHVAGVAGPTGTIDFSGDVMCSWIRLHVGQRYLFAYAPKEADGDGSLVLETNGPAWRSVMWGMTPVRLDGHQVPVDPDRLMAFLATRLASMPPTDALDPVPATPPMETAWLAIPGALGAGWWLLAARRRRRAVDLVA